MTGAVLSPGEAAAILFGIFFLLLALRMPVAFSLGLACLPILLIEPRLSAMTLVQETFNAYNSFILLAVPFFLLTANLMNVGGITDRLVRLSRSMVGTFPGDWPRSTSCSRSSSPASRDRRPPMPRASPRSSSRRSARNSSRPIGECRGLGGEKSPISVVRTCYRLQT